MLSPLAATLLVCTALVGFVVCSEPGWLHPPYAIPQANASLLLMEVTPVRFGYSVYGISQALMISTTHKYDHSRKLQLAASQNQDLVVGNHHKRSGSEPETVGGKETIVYTTACYTYYEAVGDGIVECTLTIEDPTPGRWFASITTVDSNSVTPPPHVSGGGGGHKRSDMEPLEFEVTVHLPCTYRYKSRQAHCAVVYPLVLSLNDVYQDMSISPGQTRSILKFAADAMRVERYTAESYFRLSGRVSPGIHIYQDIDRIPTEKIYSTKDSTTNQDTSRTIECFFTQFVQDRSFDHTLYAMITRPNPDITEMLFTARFEEVYPSNTYPLLPRAFYVTLIILILFASVLLITLTVLACTAHDYRKKLVSYTSHDIDISVFKEPTDPMPMESSVPYSRTD